MNKPDLTYQKDGIFTRFYPESIAGEKAWNEIARLNDGVACVLTIHLESTLQQLRKAGYSISKAEAATINDADLAELMQ